MRFDKFLSKSLAVVNQNQAKLLMVCDRLPKVELPPHFSQIVGICQLNDLDMDMRPSSFPTILIPTCLPSAGMDYDQVLENFTWREATIIMRPNLKKAGGIVLLVGDMFTKEDSSGSAVLEAGQLLYMEPPPKLVFYPRLAVRNYLVDPSDPLSSLGKRAKLSLNSTLIEVNSFKKEVTECVNNFGLTSRSNFVDLDRVVKDILSIVYEQLPAITGDEQQVPPLALIRLARGGKTTTISKVFDELKKNSEMRPILISFNGNGPNAFKRRDDAETHMEAILRLIGAQLGDYTPEEAQNLVVDREALDRHLGDNVILLIDELNNLGVPLDKDAAELLRLMFLDRRGRYLVFTCHYPVSVETDTVMSSDFLGKSPSPRGLLTVDMPLARTLSHLNELRNMSQKCLALTEERAAWLGYIPSLIYSTMNGTGITPSNRFQQSDIVVDPYQKLYVLKRFVNELLTGNRDPVVDQYYSAFQSVGANHKVSYPLCYVNEIFKQLESSCSESMMILLAVLNKLECHLDTKHSGLEWECTVKVAIILRMLCAHWFGQQGPFNMVAPGIKPELKFHTLSEEFDTLGAASRYIANIIAGYDTPTLIYVDSANARFPEVEGFVAYTNGDPTTAKTVGFQVKKSDEKPRKDIDTSLINGGAVLIRGRMTAKNPKDPKKGWIYMTTEEVRSLLGNSLLLAMPRDMLQEP